MGNLVDHIEMWTDGSIETNPKGAGGLGVLLVSDRLELAKVIGRYIPESQRNTNNRMELEAVILGLKNLVGQNLVIHIYSDSMYVVEGIRSWGYETNKDLWDKYVSLVKGNNFYIKPNLVKGHNGIPKNTVVDKVAGRSRKDEENFEDRGTLRDIMEKYQ